MTTTLTNLPEVDRAAEALALLDTVATVLRWAAFGGAESVDRQAVGRAIVDLGDHDWSASLGRADGAPPLESASHSQPRVRSPERASTPAAAPERRTVEGAATTDPATAAGPLSLLRLRSRQPLPGASAPIAGPPPGRQPAQRVNAAGNALAPAAGPQIAPIAPGRLPAFRRAVDGCDRCALHRERPRVCHGEGEAEAQLLVIVDPPRGMELAAGQAIAGDDRALLHRMMTSIGLAPAQVFVSPLVRCGPPGLGPEARVAADAAALAACRAILGKEIDLVRPRLLLLLTAAAGELLAAVARGPGETAGGVAGLRERVFELKGLPAIVSWPPSQLHSDAARRREAQADLREVKRRLGV